MTEGNGTITVAAASADAHQPAASASGVAGLPATAQVQAPDDAAWKRITAQRDEARAQIEALKVQLTDLQAVQTQLDTLKSQSEEREKRLRAVADQALAAVPEKIRAIAAKSAPEDALELVRAWQEETRNQPGPAAHPAAASPGYAGKTIEQIAALGGDAVTDYLRGLTPQERRKAIDEVWRKYG